MSEIRVDLITEKTADGGVTIKSTGTGDNKPTLLTLQTSEADIAANDVLGKIQFQAPDEGTGTDAILVSAAIQARSEGDFAADANATAIDFMVGASEAAATKMSLSSAGVLSIDTISEKTSANGVSIDSLIIKDQKITNMVGMVAQVVSVSKTDSFNTNSTSYTDITGFTASITPSSTNSKILVMSTWGWGSSASPYPDFILLRGSTSINIGNADTGATRVSVGNNTDPAGHEGNIQQEQLHHHFLDSPSSTSAVTYKWQTRTFNSGRVIYVGRTADVSDGNRATFPTNITLMEVLG